MTKLLIPCAGFGSRMAMDKDKSKELLLYKGTPLIEYALTIADNYNLKPLVITRKEKTDLIEYCDKFDIETFIIEVNGEWADTVLKSQDFWEEDNILILPDTIFSHKHKTIESIIAYLKYGNSAAFALHKVEDSTKWGIVVEDKNEKYPKLIEKPKLEGNEHYAWGLIGFKKSYGKELFEACSKKQALELKNCGFTYLEEFKDLTRTGKIEA